MPSCRFLQYGLLGREIAVVAGYFDSAQAAYLWDHLVSSRPLFPGAGFFEIASSSAKLLLQSSVEYESIEGATIPSPLMLDELVNKSHDAFKTQIVLTANKVDGTIEIGSVARGSKSTKKHFQSKVIKLSDNHISCSSRIKLFSLSSRMEKSRNVALAKISSPLHDSAAYLISPSMLDCTLQIGAINSKQSDNLFIPVGAECFSLQQVGATPKFASSEAVSSSPTASVANYMLSEGPKSCGIIKRLKGKPAGPRKISSKASRMDALYQSVWFVKGLAPAPDNLPSLSFQIGDQPDHSLVVATGLSVGQAVLSSKHSALQVLTFGMVGQQVPSRQDWVHAVKDAGLAGVSRTLAQEASKLRVSAVDRCLSSSKIKDPFFVIGGTSEADSAYGCLESNGATQVNTLVESTVKPSMEAFRLFPHPRGALNNLKPEPIDVLKVAKSDIVVSVKAVGVNFRDVLNVLGMYPGDPGPPGGDCSGVVVSCGSGVQSHRPGDAVFGLAGGSLGSHVHVAAPRMAAMPPTLSFEAAATCPTVFITVDAAFRQAAGCHPGERVLVHAAAGGVGLAAIQMAAALGGGVVATAGSPSKRSLVRSMGVAHAVGSRDTQYVSDVAQLGGVDIVLNSLTSSGMVSGSLSVLRHGGRFIEISKRDIWSGSRVSQERPDVGYTLVAVDFLPDEAVNMYLERLGSNLSAGKLNPLPLITHGLGSVRAALRQMSQARHVGKIVTRRDGIEDAHGPSGGIWYVTGGLGMIGSLIASCMADTSADKIVLLGRSGRHNSSNKNIDRLTLEGVRSTIVAYSCDTSSGSDVFGLLEDTSMELPVKVRFAFISDIHYYAKFTY